MRANTIANIFITVLIVVLTSSLTWVAKDLISPCPVCPACPDVICPVGVELVADVNGKRGDLVLEDCNVYFFKRAETKAEGPEVKVEDGDTGGGY